jgi:hypothetical protein
MLAHLEAALRCCKDVVPTLAETVAPSGLSAVGLLSPLSLGGPVEAHITLAPDEGRIDTKLVEDV